MTVKKKLLSLIQTIKKLHSVLTC
ncbi:hypothetical protein EMIT0347P_20248 [Pseudomonas sp. IT-347P]